MFKKKNKNPEVAVNSADVARNKAKNGKAGKTNGMSQVLHESVAATVEEELIKNETFTTIVKGEPRYVALELDVEDIGGLDKRSRKVEAKGALIEAVNSGHLASVVTLELMENNRLVLLPDANTLFNMLDYGILRKNPETNADVMYRLVYVHASGATNTITVTPVEPECKVSLMEIGNLVDAEGSVEDLLGHPVDDSDEGPTGMPGLFDENASAVADDEADDIESEASVWSNHSDMDEIPSLEQEEDIPEMLDDNIEDTDTSDMDTVPAMESEQVMDVPGSSFTANETEPIFEEDAMPESQAEPEQEVPAEWVQDVRVRRFFSDDLGLEISTDPFDSAFLNNNPAPQFVTDRVSNWLNDHLNEMSRQANQELQKMHSDNLFNLKEWYFNLVSRQVERIARDLDVHDSSNTFGRVRAKLDEARNNSRAEVDAEVRRRKMDMDAAWSRKLQEVGQDAARRAQAAYREHYGAQHEADIRALPDQIRAAIEADYEEAKMEINERRRAEASKLFDLCVTEVLEEVSDRYASMVADENARYREIEENMRAFIEDNRSNDIARTNTLAEELRQNDKVRELMAEHASKVGQMRADFAAERTKLQSQMDNLRVDNQHHLEEVESRAAERLQHEQARTAELRQQIQELQSQNKAIYETVRAEFNHQLEEKNSEIAALHDRQKEAADQQKRSNKLAIALVAAIAICAIGIGFIFGTYVRLDHEVKNAQHYTIEEYQAQDATE